MPRPQLREVVTRLIEAGGHKADDPPILIVVDAGYDVARLDPANHPTSVRQIIKP